MSSKGKKEIKKEKKDTKKKEIKPKKDKKVKKDKKKKDKEIKQLDDSSSDSDISDLSEQEIMKVKGEQRGRRGKQHGVENIASDSDMNFDLAPKPKKKKGKAKTKAISKKLEEIKNRVSKDKLVHDYVNSTEKIIDHCGGGHEGFELNTTDQWRVTGNKELEIWYAEEEFKINDPARVEHVNQIWEGAELTLVEYCDDDKHVDDHIHYMVLDNELRIPEDEDSEADH
jgi:hypothetical protein